MKVYFFKFLLSAYDDLLSYGSTNYPDSQYIASPTLWTIPKKVHLQPLTKEKNNLTNKPGLREHSSIDQINLITKRLKNELFKLY